MSFRTEITISQAIVFWGPLISSGYLFTIGAGPSVYHSHHEYSSPNQPAPASEKTCTHLIENPTNESILRKTRV